MSASADYLEVSRLYKNMQALKQTYAEMKKTEDYAICTEFGRAAKESLYLTNSTDIVVHTYGLGKHGKRELAFCMGPSEREGSIAIADVLVLVADLYKLLEFKHALDISSDFADESYEHSILLGPRSRQRYYEELYQGSDALAINDRTVFKNKFMPAIKREAYPWNFDVFILKPESWIS